MNESLKKLSADDLVVLYEWLSNNEEKEKVSFSDLSELVVLDKLQAILEKELTEIFDLDYGDILGGGRSRIKKEYEERFGTDTWIHNCTREEGKIIPFEQSKPFARTGENQSE